jgi:Trk-type K+ transport system membrane component
VSRRRWKNVLRIIAAFFRAVVAALRNPEYQVLVVFTLFVLIGGTAFYHYYENWSWVDSAYFVVVALTTVGFGDFAPSTEFSRMVTIGFVFFGVAWLGAFVSLLVKTSQERHHQKVQAQHQSSGEDS